MGIFGQDQEVRGAASRASREIQRAINPHRAPHRTPGLRNAPDVKEARRRYGEEHPSRFRWLFKVVEWISRDL